MDFERTTASPEIVQPGDIQYPSSGHISHPYTKVHQNHSVHTGIKFPQLAPSLRVSPHITTHTHPSTRKHTKSILPDAHLPITPPHDIGPDLPTMQLADKHLLLPGLCVAHQHGHAVRAIPGAPSHPADDMGVVKVVVLVAVREELARQGQVRDLALRGGAAPVVFDAAFEAVHVAVEEAGIWSNE